MAAPDSSAGILTRPINIDDYDAMMALWHSLPGIGLSEADSRASIGAYLARNPGMSLAALDGRELIGTILGGHDGRRGYLHHLAVSAPYRQGGVGRLLVEHSLELLKAAGISKSHLFVYCDNPAQEFWQKLGWQRRSDIVIMSKQI